MTPEFLRRYYVMRIITTPKVYGLPDGYVALEQLQGTLEDIRERNADDVLYEKLELHSRKTINRDLKKIESYYKVFIKHKRNYGFYVEDNISRDEEQLKEVYEKTELYLLNHHAHAWKDFVTSARTSLSTYVDIVGLINAIDLQLLVELEYKGWYDDNKFTTFKGVVQPLHIKEINNAWYLIARHSEKGINAFCLDRRIREFKVTTRKAVNQEPFDEAEYFKNSIGILRTGMKPEWIHLKVSNHHLRYLEANKMHPSQEVISYPKKPETDFIDFSDPDIWGEIKICVEPNYEFLMEVLKYNLWVQVVSPKSVRDMVASHVDRIADYYK
ncbi:helix-turn-helix transcriptional regulator [Robertkochia sediminum]|uniref:helix-turn-helix transcriptional regulator n=1 Tax=Robertkochia sediminum TaxID=2785326 RepID=UPI0019315F05|nr:WYL domain-containing protein [Robertkochia sediminum]MBL7472047.1 WYL domain-containing protein [Robertkochia sediminum]